MTNINLVKYAGDYWVSLSSLTNTRSTQGYSNAASVKSALRTFSIKQDPSNYIAFRGEQQLKNIAAENVANPLFIPEEFQGTTRAGLISFDILGELNERFTVAKDQVESVKKFMKYADEFIQKDRIATSEKMASDTIADTSSVTSRSMVLKQLRAEVNKIDKQLEQLQENRGKLLQALNALETLEIVQIG